MLLAPALPPGRLNALVGLLAPQGGLAGAAGRSLCWGHPPAVQPPRADGKLWTGNRKGGCCLLTPPLLPACTAKASAFHAEWEALIRGLISKECARNCGFLVTWGRPSGGTLHSKGLGDTRGQILNYPPSFKHTSVTSGWEYRSGMPLPRCNGVLLGVVAWESPTPA